MWEEEIKRANVSIHVIATGAGAGAQNKLWSVPGSSAYLSGASFPYATEETEEILGFKPESFCSEDMAIDLASAAYMKAFKFGGKAPIGVGLTASVSSDRIHRGEHRFYSCIISDNKILAANTILEKRGSPSSVTRYVDGKICDKSILESILDTIGIIDDDRDQVINSYADVTNKATLRFMSHPFFTMDGRRHSHLPNGDKFALMPGAFNPPHEGHFGMADSFTDVAYKRVVFEVSASAPHKAGLSVQDLLRRAKMLQGRDRLFTNNMPLYLDKAKAFPGMDIILGADAMLRMLNPKWGIDKFELIKKLYELKTSLFISDRVVDGVLIDYLNLIDNFSYDGFESKIIEATIKPLPGRWDISSTELRNKLNG